VTESRVAAGRRFNDLSKALIEKVSQWNDERWSAPCEVHGESANARRLVEHVTARSATVVKHIEVLFDRSPSLLEDNGSDPLASLITSRGAVARLLESLDESEIQRLHASDIDGEHDVLLASCGLIGHWEFHLHAIRPIEVTG